jgi:iron complex transport system substrate-binding protein
VKPGTPILAALAFLLLVGGCTDRPQDSAPARPNRAQRLLCLAPNLTETLFALGLGDRVVAVTDNDHHPPQVESLPRVGGMQPDYERILALHPDLVLLDANLQGQEIRARLEGLGLPVLALKTRTLADLQANLPLLGRALGAERQAAEALAAFQAGLQEVERAARSLPHAPRVFVEIWGEPLMTAGSTSLVHEMIERSGGDNVYGDLSETYPTISLEDLVRRDPEILLLTTLEPAELPHRAGWQRLTAVREGRVCKLEPDLVVRPTLRSLEGLQNLVQVFGEAGR